MPIIKIKSAMCRLLAAMRLRVGAISHGVFGGGSSSMAETFSKIYHTNYWGNKDSRSGGGSDMNQTDVIRQQLPLILEKLDAKSMLDIPCGDFHWMKAVDLNLLYIGADIVPDIVSRNQDEYGSERRRFECLDLSKDDLPKVDVIFCRDVLVHFSFDDIFLALRNMARSGSKYLITTTFTDRQHNVDIMTGQWRTLNLIKPPFDFPEPLILLNENCTEGDGSWGDKSLGVWRFEDVIKVTHG